MRRILAIFLALSHRATGSKLRRCGRDGSGSDDLLQDPMSNAVPRQAIPMLSTSDKRKRRNCASACAASLGLIGLVVMPVASHIRGISQITLIAYRSPAPPPRNLRAALRCFRYDFPKNTVPFPDIIHRSPDGFSPVRHKDRGTGLPAMPSATDLGACSTSSGQKNRRL